MTVTLAPVDPNAVELVSWVDASNAEHVLTNGVTIALMVGRRGWWMPLSRVLTQDLALQPGEAFRSVKDLSRDVNLPVFIDVETPAAARDALRELSRWFDPTAGDGWLKVDYGDVVRRLRARPLGLEAAEDLDQWTIPRRAVASVRALHPYWQDETPQTVTFEPGEGAGDFFPIFPMRLSPSSLFAKKPVTNAGDVDAWPIWTIEGPAQNVVLTNVTTGAQLALRTEFILLVGETLTIDTRPLVRSVLDQSGNRVFGYQTSTSELWALAPGINDIRVQIGSLDTSETFVTLSYTQEYRAP